MAFDLKVTDGKVKYLFRRGNQIIGSDTKVDAALNLLSRGQPYKSAVFPDYPIAVQSGEDEYFFAGRWIEPKRRRRIKDVVLE
jgi:hypothetical protein